MAEQAKTTKLPKLAQIEVGETVEFNNIISTATVTSSELEKHISELFGSTFVDFEGCKIIGQQSESLKCKLYFKPVTVKGEGLYAVKVRGEEVFNKRKAELSLAASVNFVNKLTGSKQFELENLAKELLAEFLIIDPKNTTIIYRYNEDIDKDVQVRLPKNWNQYIEELSDNDPRNPQFHNPYLAVVVDLLPIVAKLYGKKDPEELKALSIKGLLPRDRYQYSVNIVKFLNANMGSYILEIRRIDIKELNKLANTIGCGNVNGGILMTRR